MKLILSAMTLFAMTCNSLAQTPFDSFAKSDKKKEMLGEKHYVFRSENADTTSKIKYVELHLESMTLVYYDRKNSIVKNVNLDPKDFKWLSVDPLANKYPAYSPYNYVCNNPINAIDPDGQRVVFVNGYYNTGDGAMPKSMAENLTGTVGGRGYWSGSFICAAQNYFNDKNTPAFVDGRGAWNSSAESRFDAGYSYAKANLTTLTAGMTQGETIKIVSHSMGAAYSEGMIKYLQEQNIAVEQVVHLSPADPKGMKASSATTYQLNLENDAVLMYKNEGSNYMVSGADRYGQVSTDRNFISDYISSHADTKFDASVWKMVSDLKNIQMNISGNTLSTPLGTISGASNSYNSTGNSNGTQFNILNLGGTEYKGTGKLNNFIGPLQF